MAAVKTLDAKASRLGVAAWCLYDWANSAFPTIVTTFIFSVYFTQAVAQNPVEGAVQWSHSVAGAALLVVVGGPVLGAIADAFGRRKPWLLMFTLLTVIAVSALWFVEPTPRHVVLAQVLYGVAATSYGFAMVFYGAMLRNISPPAYIGRISGWGWALGYAGGLACLIIALVFFVNAEPLPFGLDRETYEHVRATNVIAALWFALFAIPLFMFTPDRPATHLAVNDAVHVGLRRFFGNMRQILQNRLIARFLAAHLFYTNGLNTLFAFGAIYAAGTFQMTLEQVLYFGIALNVAAGIGAASFAWIDDVIGSKKTILIALFSLTVLGLLLVVVTSKTMFFVLGCLLGLFVGPAQAAGRALMARLAPAGQETQVFGLYELAGKATIFVGPLVLGVATHAFQSQRVGMSTILLFFAVGIILLLPMRPPQQHV